MKQEIAQSFNQYQTETATLGGGCFWCLEAVFGELKGVEQVVSGYTGGFIPDPSYKEVCSGNSGHAEAIQITFNPETISFKEILRIFFIIHDPTTLNRQGADFGTQYRSAIFYQNPEQKKIADEVMSEVKSEKIWKAPIVTELNPLEVFYRAEDYHQNYYKRNPNQPYCMAVITPKIAKFRKHYFEKLKK